MSSGDEDPSGGIGDAEGLERGGRMRPSVGELKRIRIKEIGIKKGCGSELTKVGGQCYLSTVE